MGPEKNHRQLVKKLPKNSQCMAVKKRRGDSLGSGERRESLTSVTKGVQGLQRFNVLSIAVFPSRISTSLLFPFSAILLA